MAKSKSKKKLVVLIIILLALIVTAVVLMMKRDEAEIMAVVEEVGRRTITQTVSAIGKIQPETQVNISSETSGEIVFLGVEEGDTVKTGDLLVRIKPDIIETQLEQQRAALEAAKMEIEVRNAEKERAKNSLKRINDLYSKEFASQEEFDRAKTAYEQAVSSYKAALSRYSQAKASLKQIERSADRTTIYSPIDGIITRLSVEKGEKAVGTEMMQGTEMMVVSDLTVMNAEVEVDENDIVLVKIGDTARIEIDAFPERIFDGVVREIGHSAIMSQLGTQDQVTNFKVKIRLIESEPLLRPGMSCNSEIETETKQDVISVPLQSVTVRTSNINKKPDVSEVGIREKEQDDKKVKKRPPSVVFLKKGSKAKKAVVQTGISDDGYIEITEGVNEGDTVISGSFLAISKKLKDGATIKIKNKKKFSNKKGEDKE